MNRIDIIISTFNRANSLKRTLLSLEEMKWPSGYEYSVIAADNNSTDETRELVEGLAKRLPYKLRYCQESKPGKAHAMTKGLNLSKADIAAFIDDDVTLDANWMDVVIKNFQDKRISGLTGKIIPVYTLPKPTWYSDQLSIVLGSVDLMPERKETRFATGANMAFRRTVLETVGFTGELNGLVNEDTLLSHKVNKQNFKIMYDPSLIVYHHFQEEKFNREYFRQYYWNSGRTIAFVSQQSDQQEKKKIFGIPLWRFRQAFEHQWRAWKNRNDEQLKFYHELQMNRFQGYLHQKWWSKNGAKN